MRLNKTDSLKVLVTGATGFVGQHLISGLLDRSYQVVACVRKPHLLQFATDASLQTVVLDDLCKVAQWREFVFQGVDVVIHTAARVHVLEDQSADPLTRFRQVNTQATRLLAERAAANGVKRLIYLSSIKVNGEQTFGVPYTASDIPAPEDDYAISKAEAESALLEVAEKTDLEVVIIRPPLVYGPGVKANFLALRNWVSKGYPLPLGAIFNQRSLVSVFNLVDLIQCCISHPNAANEIFLVSDGEAISTTTLIQRIAQSLDRSIWLPRIPVAYLEFFAGLFGRAAWMKRLCSDLEVDIQKTVTELDWTPSVTMEQTLDRMVIEREY
ncbi:UDP-glucose 4-epimerase family protein [Motiliproteus sp.]|uniref:UDP-glucose 4-epimerase family protein n=1 Tax=Motiliproteus sp. TaxID=1898955 RepID=UPI003BA97840